MALTTEEQQKYQQIALTFFDRAGITLTEAERAHIEIAELGLGEYEQTGVALLVYVNTERVCAKELVLMPGQTCPQHLHPSVGTRAGKEETFRCRWGEMYLYIPGEPAPNPKATPPQHRRQYYTVWHEIILCPGDQYTLAPETWHWFQGGPEGAVVSEFSTRSTDENDVFTDPATRRVES
jgi:D-lyxose ketol-isomerase